MNERQVSIDNETRPLPSPFVVIATQNPQDFHGTYPLPESQLDGSRCACTWATPPRTWSAPFCGAGDRRTPPPAWSRC
ncbi:MAG: AAA family ATPase [bacterium]